MNVLLRIGLQSLLMIGCLSLQLACTHRGTTLDVQVEQPVLPVLTLKGTNPVLKLTVVRQDSVAASLNQLTFSLVGTTDLQDISGICLYGSLPNGHLDSLSPLTDVLAPDVTVTCHKPIPLNQDTTILWVGLTLRDQVNLRHRIGIRLQDLSSSNPVRIQPVEPVLLRTGVALRQHGADGIHTSRIPGLETAVNGDLIAIYDARYESSRDLQGDIDICMQRSTDGGMSWGAVSRVLDQGKWGRLPEKFNGVSDANILVDRTTGHLYVAGLWMHGVKEAQTGRWIPNLTADSTCWNHQWRGKGSQPGWDVTETSQYLLTKSEDNGYTWSEPMNLTRELKNHDWWLAAPAPGHGITLDDGTLVIPSQGRDAQGRSFSSIVWSKDKGKSWHMSKPAFSNVTECMAVQLSDGRIMLNMRDNTNRGDSVSNGRRICVTDDLGETWLEHPTSKKALVEPTCMASLHKHTYQEQGQTKSILLFLNPESFHKRDHITLKVSYDDGMTWPSDRKILLDEYAGRGYSCITSINDSLIGVLYESSQADLVFQQIGLDELR